MDSRSFDSLTKSLAAAKTRRGLLGAITAIGAGLLGAKAADAQVIQVSCGNQFCASNPGGCNAGCVCCVYTNAITGTAINSRCRPPGTCSPGTVACPPGQVLGPSGVCAAPTTTTTTTTTTTVAPCPFGLAEGAQCGTGLVCLDGACVGTGGCTQGCSGSTGDCTCTNTIEGGIASFISVGLEVPICSSSAECDAGQLCRFGCGTLQYRCGPVCLGAASSFAAAIDGPAGDDMGDGHD